MRRVWIFAICGVGVAAVACVLSYQRGFDAGRDVTPMSVVDVAEIDLGAGIEDDIHAELAASVSSAIPQVEVPAPSDAVTTAALAPTEEMDVTWDVVDVAREAPSENTFELAETEDVTLATILELTADISDPVERRERIKEWTSQLDRRGVEESLVELETMTLGPMRNDAAFAVVHRLAQLDPMTALEYAGSEAQPKLRYEMKQQALQGWATSNPAEALAHAEANPNNDLPRSRFQDVFEGARAAGIQQTFEFLEATDTKKYTHHMMETVWESFKDYPQEVVAWSQALPTGKLRDLALHRTVDHWARFDPLAAKTWMEQVTEPHNRLANNIELGESWARVDPKSAASWYASLPADQRSGKIIDRIYKRWVQYEPRSAETWLRAQPSGPEMDGPIAQFVEASRYTDPKTAMEWASRISRDSMRAEQMRSTGWRYVKNSPKEALGFLQADTSIAPEMRQRMIDYAQRRLAPKASSE